MKLLFDENLSPRLPRLVVDLFPDSSHVRDVAMKGADDPIVWDHAKDNDFMIVSRRGHARPKFGFWGSAKGHLAATWKLFNATG